MFVVLSQVRDEELPELDTLVAESCRLPVMGGTENVHGKVKYLLAVTLVTCLSFFIVFIVIFN